MGNCIGRPSHVSHPAHTADAPARKTLAPINTSTHDEAAHPVKIYEPNGLPHPARIDRDTVHAANRHLFDEHGYPRSVEDARESLGLARTKTYESSDLHSFTQGQMEMSNPQRGPEHFANVHPDDGHVQATPRSMHLARSVLGDGAEHAGTMAATAEGQATKRALFETPHRTYITSAESTRPIDRRERPGAGAYSSVDAPGEEAIEAPSTLVRIPHDQAAMYQNGALTRTNDMLSHELTHAGDHALASHGIRGDGAPTGEYGRRQKAAGAYFTSTESHATYAEMAHAQFNGNPTLNRPRYTPEMPRPYARLPGIAGTDTKPYTSVPFRTAGNESFEALDPDVNVAIRDYRDHLAQHAGGIEMHQIHFATTPEAVRLQQQVVKATETAYPYTPGG